MKASLRLLGLTGVTILLVSCSQHTAQLKVASAATQEESEKPSIGGGGESATSANSSIGLRGYLQKHNLSLGLGAKAHVRTSDSAEPKTAHPASALPPVSNFRTDSEESELRTSAPGQSFDDRLSSPRDPSLFCTSPIFGKAENNVLFENRDRPQSPNIN